MIKRGRGWGEPVDNLKIFDSMLKIEIPYSEVKGKRLEFEWNKHLLMAWLFIVEDDDIVKVWEFRFEEL